MSCLGQLVRAAWSATAAMTADPIMSAATFNAFPMAREGMFRTEIADRTPNEARFRDIDLA